MMQALTNFYQSLRSAYSLRQRMASMAKKNPDLVQQFLKNAETSESDLAQAMTALAQRQQDMLAFQEEFQHFNQLLLQDGQAPLSEAEMYPCLYDRTSQTEFDRHYIYHPAWAARVLAQSRPQKHIDISSTLHFCTLVSAFISVDFYDYRPAAITLSNLQSAPADLTNLSFANDSVSSLSCMHVIEHIGLGRYGDAYDTHGDRKAAHELSRVLAPNGQLLIALPVGRPRIQFNAHRIYSHEQVLSLFSELVLKEFCLIPDGEVKDGPINNPTPSLVDSQSYGCGCYVFTKAEPFVL